MALNDLTTLASVKAWLGRTDSNSDQLLAALITSASRQIYSHLQRPTILPRTVTELRDGTGTQKLTLKQWPAISVSSLIIDNLTVPASPAMTGSTTPISGTAMVFGGARQPGYMLEVWDGTPPGRPQTLSLSGYVFGRAFPGARNFQDVQVVYSAGYQVSNEAATVDPTSYTAVPLAPYGMAAVDVGVTYANGTPLKAVKSNPTQGQYIAFTPMGLNTPGRILTASASPLLLLSTDTFVGITNGTGGALEIDLPITPSANQVVSLYDMGNNLNGAGVYGWTIKWNGTTVGTVLNTGGFITLIYNGVGWFQIAPGYGLLTVPPGSLAYQFSSADAGASVLLNYGYIPSDLQDTCNELVSERYKYSQRIGERTHSLGGNETVAYDTTRMTPLIAGMLQPYRMVLPV